METTRLSSKGQIVLPKSIRDGRALQAGATFTVEATEEGILLRPIRVFPKTTVEQVLASLGPPKRRKALTEANIRLAITKAVKERHARGRY